MNERTNERTNERKKEQTNKEKRNEQMNEQNFCKPRPRTNTGKQMFSYQAINLWRDIPYYLKDLNTFSFAKEIKHYLLSEQYSKKFE